MIQSKSIFKILFFLGVLTANTSCQDMLSTDNDRYQLAKDYLIASPNDTVYSILGILNKVQQIGDQYVLSGELRGDLMTTTPYADSELQDLNNFTVDKSSSRFANPKDFYSIINNCNFFIQRADTSIAEKGHKSFLNEVKVARTIRAWTYLQLVLNYGKASYFWNPILTVADSNQKYPECDLAQLVDSLIPEISSIHPLTSTFPAYVPSHLLIDPNFLLGDLYLWKASLSHSKDDYEQAATYYASLIAKEPYLISSQENGWRDSQMKEQYSITQGWTYGLDIELISIIGLNTSKFDGPTFEMKKLCQDNKVNSTTVMDSLFRKQVYCYYDATTTPKTLLYGKGDLRQIGAMQPFILSSPTIKEGSLYIGKYDFTRVVLYRTSLLYLRYAEAVNRAGKPGLAFAVLKYGLCQSVLADKTKVPTADVADNKNYVSIFSRAPFDYVSIGIHDHGSGQSYMNALYVINNFTRYVNLKNVAGNDSVDATGTIVQGPTRDAGLMLEAKTDSISYVEDAICNELALETGFEGNRFQDLMRLSNHRDDPTYLAKKVASKHKENYNSFLLKLSTKDNWYLPTR